jgi:hypothetical protein
MPSKKLDRRSWLRHARAWKKSGLSCSEYAAANELSAGSLSWWAWKLRSEGQDVPGGRPERRGQPKARSRKRSRRSDAPSFIEVAAIPQASRGGGIEIEASGMVIRAEVGFDEAHLARVLAAVEARR